MAEIEKVIEDLESIKRTLYNLTGSNKNERKVDKAIRTIRELNSKSEEVCEWKLFDEETNAYNTTCGGDFWLNDGSPKDNGFKYCPYCGRKLRLWSR